MGGMTPPGTWVGAGAVVGGALKDATVFCRVHKGVRANSKRSGNLKADD